MFALKAIKALADETRLRLALILSKYELSVNEIVSLLDMGQSRISRHLKILTDAGLVAFRRDGLWVYYSAVPSSQGQKFLNSLMPFILDMPMSQPDLDMAKHILEERTQKTRQFFNAIAEDWDALNTTILGEFDLPVYVAAQVPKGCEVAVDLGCGTGGVLDTLKTKAKNVIGVDGSSRMLELARRRFLEETASNTNKIGSHKKQDTQQKYPVSLRIGELDHLPLRDKEADFACINLVLHHISDPRVALTEIKRILKTNAKLLVIEFKKHENEKMRTEYGDRWLGFDEEQFIKLAQSCGFEKESISYTPVKQDLTLFQLILTT